ncbi:MAG: DUF302 domain-containing protein [Thiovulaceae bacterium]|nr:DUF302 domain-containing protein [Sulfurimonadaceae bacterium]
MKKIFLAILLLSLSLWADSVYTKNYDAPMSEIYPKLLASFDNASLIVVSEIDILEKFNASGLPEAFGKEFNTNNLTGIKAVIACNGWFGNEIANSDPLMMAFCPVRVTLIERDGKTSIMYVRPSAAPKDSKAYGLLKKLQEKVISAIEDAH